MTGTSDFQKKISDLCWVLDDFRRTRSFQAESHSRLCKDAKIYGISLNTLEKNEHADVIELLQEAEFRPFLILNGFIFFSSLKPNFRNQILEVLSVAIKEFSQYYEKKEEGLDRPNSASEEKRFFAFLLAYLPKAGMDLLGIMMTMKGDSSLASSSFALREILDGDEGDLMRSPLFNEDERVYLRMILEKSSLESWTALSDYLIQKYQLPKLSLAPLGA